MHNLAVLLNHLMKVEESYSGFSSRDKAAPFRHFQRPLQQLRYATAVPLLVICYRGYRFFED